MLRDHFPEWACVLDFPTLEKLSPELVGDDLGQRRADMVWRVRYGKASWPYLLILLEFQARPDRYMPLRTADYRQRVLQEMIREEVVGPNGELPACLGVVVYNGWRRWNAASDIASLITPGIPDAVLARTTPEGRKVFGVHADAQYHLVELRAFDPAVLAPDRWLTRLVVAERGRWTRRLPDARELDTAIGESGDEFIRLAFSNLYREVARRAGVPESVLTMTEFFREGGMIESEHTLLAANFREMKEELRREGRQEGRQEGERALVRRLIADRFGEDTAARVSPLLARLSDPHRIAAVVRAVFQSETGEEFIARAGEV